MKKILNFLIVFLIIFVWFQKPVLAHLSLPHAEIADAQEATNLKFLIVNYTTLEDVEFLFQNSSRVLGYFEDIEGDLPFFMTLVNDEQSAKIQEKNLENTLIDEKTDVSSYMLLYNHSVDQSEKLRPYVVEVYPLSSHYTLIKVNQENFDPHQIPDAVEFGPVPFLEEISPPPAIQSPTTQPIQESGSSNSEMGILPLVIGGVVVFVILSGMGIFLFLRKRKSLVVPDNTTVIDPPVEDQEPPIKI